MTSLNDLVKATIKSKPNDFKTAFESIMSTRIVNKIDITQEEMYSEETLEEGPDEPKGEDEKEFKDKNVSDKKTEHPTAGDEVFKGDAVKKNPRLADRKKGEDEEVNE